MSLHEVETLKRFADDAVNGSASESQISGAWAVLDKLGPAGLAIWSEVKDIAARTVAAMMRP
jgi:hypothetical protein